MEFNSGYMSMGEPTTPMDRDFYGGSSAPRQEEGSLGGGDNPWGVGVKNIGMSVPMGIAAPNAQGIATKIRAGVNAIEIGFPTQGSGNRNAQTPGMYGKDQRQAIKEIGMANDVQFTTHAAYNVMGLTGMQQQGSDMYKFDMNMARIGQNEIERAIDFAADVPGGGSVVVHTGEFIRPLTDMYLPDDYGKNLSRAKDGRIMFKQRVTEDKDAKFYLIDDRTGQAMNQVQKDRLVPLPKWNRYESDNGDYWNKGGGKPYRDRNGNLVRPGDYIDYEGNKIDNPYDPLKGRVPVYNRETGRFDIEYLNYDDFEKEAQERNKYLERAKGRKLEWHEKVTQNEAFMRATMETNEGTARGWSKYYGAEVPDSIDALEKLRKAKEIYQKLDDSLPEEEKWKFLQRVPAIGGRVSQIANEYVPSELKSPLDLIDEAIKQAETNIEYGKQASAAQEVQAFEIAEQKKHLIEPIKYVHRYALRGYAESAIHAMERSKDPNNPIVLTLEHIFPERFGGHPEEHMWIVREARKKMVDLLTQKEIELGSSFADKPTFKKNPKTGELELEKQPNPFYRKGISRKEAEKLAEQHLKITVDTAHLNLWRKHFQPKPGASPEESEKEFETWYLGQVEKMAKEGMIGNMHLVDNFGYQDEHLAPGQGNAPIMGVMDVLHRYGYDKAFTVEPGADASTDLSDFHGLMKTWRLFGSSIYGMGGGGGMGMPGGGRGQSWGSVQYGYFGQNQPPYFVFGSYAPSNDWTLWTQTPLE